MTPSPRTPSSASPPAAEKDALFAEERKIRILEEIEQKKKVTVAYLSGLFEVSGATIRTYLRDMERAGALIRTHGGAIIKTKTGFEPNSRQKEVQNLPAKRRIAQEALHLIEDGDTIILDTGTTTAELARCLGKCQNLTVVTNDFVIAQVLEDTPGINTILMGGTVRKGFHCTVGIQGREITAGLTADKAFMAANGVSATKGLTTPDINHAETKRRMIAIAGKVIVLCDHSKIGKVSFAQFATIDQVDVLVTDPLESAERQAFEKQGVEVISAS
jgi:DeoR family fructose operon transcriptional repressor